MDNLDLRVRALVPEAENLKDFIVIDRRDGTGEVLENWSHASPQPSKVQLSAVSQVQMDQVVDNDVEVRAAKEIDESKMQRMLFEVNFDQENRIRALEGKTVITKATYRTALIAKYKAFS